MVLGICRTTLNSCVSEFNLESEPNLASCQELWLRRRTPVGIVFNRWLIVGWFETSLSLNFLRYRSKSLIWFVIVELQSSMIVDYFEICKILIPFCLQTLDMWISSSCDANSWSLKHRAICARIEIATLGMPQSNLSFKIRRLYLARPSKSHADLCDLISPSFVSLHRAQIYPSRADPGNPTIRASFDLYLHTDFTLNSRGCETSPFARIPTSPHTGHTRTWSLDPVAFTWTSVAFTLTCVDYVHLDLRDFHFNMRGLLSLGPTRLSL